jgi:hypothetical protein
MLARVFWSVPGYNVALMEDSPSQILGDEETSDHFTHGLVTLVGPIIGIV